MILTISLRSVFQADVKGKGGILLEKLVREGLPPKVVTFLNKTEKNTEKISLRDIMWKKICSRRIYCHIDDYFILRITNWKQSAKEGFARGQKYNEMKRRRENEEVTPSSSSPKDAREGRRKGWGEREREKEKEPVSRRWITHDCLAWNYSIPPPLSRRNYPLALLFTTLSFNYASPPPLSS